MELKNNISLADTIINLGETSKSSSGLESAFRAFLEESKSYRLEYLQANFNTAFDGYSYMGQEDSLNQYSSDKLHSFVLSSFSPVSAYPKAFKNYLETEFLEIKAVLKKQETALIEQLNDVEFLEIYNKHFDYMVSCNYYPKIEGELPEERLSMHKDVSLLSFFPYGIAQGFVYKNNQGINVQLGERNEIFAFKGYATEFFLNNEGKALEHKVDVGREGVEERFSFAFFSMPKPDAVFTYKGVEYTAKDYYETYLNLF